jgi:hypothetical protein
MWGNILTGTLPPSFGAWGASIEDIDLSENELTAPLPESYGHWRTLVLVALWINNLTGTLPSSFGNWGNWGTSLEKASFDDNQLVGTFPPSYGSWTQVQSVNFSSNCLDDKIPEEYQEQWMNFDSMLTSANEEDIFVHQSNVTADGRCMEES